LFYDNFISLKGLKRSTSRFVLKKMKNEFERRHRLSSDIFADAEATKIVCELLVGPENRNCLPGYVQKIDKNPFGVLLVSHLQVIVLYIMFE
jgi:hypothetical protein